MMTRTRFADATLYLFLMLPLLRLYADMRSAEWVLADAIPPSGEAAALLMFAAMAIGPFVRLFGLRRPFLQWLMRRRRNIGVAAFCYAVLHLGFYLADMGSLDFILAEIGAPGIWTGWFAFFLMALPAAASNDWSMRLLRRRWKLVQRLLYGVVALTIIHWALLMYGWTEPLVHAAPMLLLYGAAAIRYMLLRKRTTP
ncbi:ferric reductase-like transmembrane domain-containing protein [Sphingobium fluviale]|uniref:Iron reductase n=1 Tax=Sphingobium fluviale TaxID=2506423 RepID=A0A4V1N3Y0_9SPHN|nr:ferric reductase-like transmembrane domain-containing protein [Sphingobium fluviale]RXR30236.1 iron reductase [Sphingobium fluviale]